MCSSLCFHSLLMQLLSPLLMLSMLDLQSLSLIWVRTLVERCSYYEQGCNRIALTWWAAVSLSNGKRLSHFAWETYECFWEWMRSDHRCGEKKQSDLGRWTCVEVIFCISILHSLWLCCYLLSGFLGTSLPNGWHFCYYRYTPYTQKVKELVTSGELGKVINIQHVEPVGFWHFAHSYVRWEVNPPLLWSSLLFTHKSARTLSLYVR